MTTFVAGSRIRFTAEFRTAGKLADPKRVTATVNGVEVEPQKGELGTMWIMVVVEEGPLEVVFSSSTGERSATQYEVVAAQATEESLESTVARIMAETPPPPPMPVKLDRAVARSRLKSAGIVLDEAWSDDKVRGILEGLDANDRQRRVYKY